MAFSTMHLQFVCVCVFRRMGVKHEGSLKLCMFPVYVHIAMLCGSVFKCSDMGAFLFLFSFFII